MFRTNPKSFYILFIILIALCIDGAHAQILDLQDEREIQAASRISQSIDRLSEKVMRCIESQQGVTKGCICADLESCKFTSEYKDATEMYCEAIARYPHWQGKTLNFTVPSSPGGYALGMEGLERQFGRYCAQ